MNENCLENLMTVDFGVLNIKGTNQRWNFSNI